MHSLLCISQSLHCQSSPFLINFKSKKKRCFCCFVFVFNNKEPTDSKVQVKDEANVVVVVGGVVVVDVVVDVVTFVFGK